MKSIAASAFAALALLMPLSANADETAPDSSSSMKVQLGLTYIGGFSNLVDVYEDYGFEFDYEIPFGLNARLCQEFSSGWGWDLSIGPVVMIEVEDNGYNDGDTSWIVPLEGNVRYTFAPASSTSGYVRGGLSCLCTSGDAFDSDGVGFCAGVGVEFNRKNSVSYGIEASYNSAQVEFNTADAETVKPYEFCLTFFVAF